LLLTSLPPIIKKAAPVARTRETTLTTFAVCVVVFGIEIEIAFGGRGVGLADIGIVGGTNVFLALFGIVSGFPLALALINNVIRVFIMIPY
jgi:hypothetical protein